MAQVFSSLKLIKIANKAKLGAGNNYHCHHKHYRPEKILSELFPAILDCIITGNIPKELLFGPITENTLPFTDPMTLGLKFHEQNPAMNYRMKIPQQLIRSFLTRTLLGRIPNELIWKWFWWQ